MAEISRESLRALENSLTPEQKQMAFSIAKDNGWKSGEVPMYIWQQIFLQAKCTQPVKSPYQGGLQQLQSTE